MNYNLTPISSCSWSKPGFEVRGIDLKTENRKEVIDQIKKDVTEHRLLVFKDQGLVSGDRQVEISKWFGDLEIMYYQHEKSPHPQVFRISNDEEVGTLGAGCSGWHIDGAMQTAPYAYSLYHIVNVPSRGATLFAPLTEVIENLPPHKFAEWDKLYIVGTKPGPVNPLIYIHPRTGKQVMCFHLGFISDFIYDYRKPYERTATPIEFMRIITDIRDEFVKDNGKMQYAHEWQEGDFMITDNCAVAHLASSDSQLPPAEVGLRVLHRTTVRNPVPPSKVNYTAIARDNKNAILKGEIPKSRPLMFD